MMILIVGDSHGNGPWWTDTVEPLAARLDVDAIVQVGAFGYWPSRHGPTFQALVGAGDRPVYFIDGNHEHHSQLAGDVTAARHRHGIDDPTAPVPLRGNLTYLPRGGRVSFDGVRFAACGGAVSIDRLQRFQGATWFLEEQITDDDLELLAAGGPADVLLTHDAPAGHPIPRLRPRWQLPDLWQPLVPRSEEHRHGARAALEAVQPALVAHDDTRRALATYGTTAPTPAAALVTLE